MTVPQQPPQPEGPKGDHLDSALSDLQRELARLDPWPPTSLARPSPSAAPPTPRPAVAVAPPAVGKWGPSNPPAAHPLQLLMSCADQAHKLLDEIGGLAEGLTGDATAPRTRSPVKLPRALLPAVAVLATEIGHTHAEIGRRLAELRGRL